MYHERFFLVSKVDNKTLIRRTSIKLSMDAQAMTLFKSKSHAQEQLADTTKARITPAGVFCAVPMGNQELFHKYRISREIPAPSFCLGKGSGIDVPIFLFIF